MENMFKGDIKGMTVEMLDSIEHTLLQLLLERFQ